MSEKKKDGKSGSDIPIAEVLGHLLFFLLRMIVKLSKFLFQSYGKSDDDSLRKIEYVERCDKVTLDRLTLGVTSEGREVNFSDIDGPKHINVTGGSRSGKSNLLDGFFNYYLANNLSTIIFMPKADNLQNELIYNMCKINGRTLYVFGSPDCKGTMININPLRDGDHISITDRVFYSFDWSNEYYMTQCYTALAHVVSKICRSGEIVDYYKVFRGFDSLRKDTALLKRLVLSQKEITSLYNKLKGIVDSPMGGYLREIKGETYSFHDLWEKNMFVYLELPVLKYKNIFKPLGRAFIGDICHAISVKFKETTVDDIDNMQWANVMIDELGSFYIDSLIDAINKSLGVKLRFILGYQSRSDILRHDPHALDQMEISLHEFFVFNQGTELPANHYAQSCGTYETTKVTSQTDGGEVADKGSIREARELIVHPDIIKKLDQGQCIRRSLFPKKVQLINVNYFDPSLFQKEADIIASLNVKTYKPQKSMPFKVSHNKFSRISNIEYNNVNEAKFVHLLNQR